MSGSLEHVIFYLTFFFILMILKPSQQLFQRLRLTLDRLTALHVLKLSLLHCATFTRHLRGCLKSALTKTKAERFLRTAGGYPRCLLQGFLLLLHWRSYICKVGSLVPHAPCSADGSSSYPKAWMDLVPLISYRERLIFTDNLSPEHRW